MQSDNRLIKKTGDYMKDKILTKIVGVQYHQGIDSIRVNETVQVVKDTTSEFPQVLAVFNEAGEQVGNIVSNVDDFDLVVNGVVNNFELYDEVENYEFKVKRIAKYYVTLVGTLKEPDDVSLEDLEALVKNLKDSVHLMICALDELGCNDILASNHIKSQLDSTIKLHNQMSNRLIELQNAASNDETVVFDYYSQEAAK